MLKPPTTWQVQPGLTPYNEAIETMQTHIAAIRAGAAPEKVWLVEHPPLYTAGTSAQPNGLKDPTRFPTFATGRGGQWTYHGPGQRVAYVMLDLTTPHSQLPPRDVRAYVQSLELWLIHTLAHFGVAAETREGRIGLWVTLPSGAESKIAAIGVRVTRWVTWHGVALNIAPNLDHFSGIIPCGIAEHGVTSLAALGMEAKMSDVDTVLEQNFRSLFG